MSRTLSGLAPAARRGRYAACVIDVPPAVAATPTCDRCGAPLEVPAGAGFVVCGHCGVGLRVTRPAGPGGAIVTERLDELLARADRIEAKLDALGSGPAGTPGAGPPAAPASADDGRRRVLRRRAARNWATRQKLLFFVMAIGSSGLFFLGYPRGGFWFGLLGMVAYVAHATVAPGGPRGLSGGRSLRSKRDRADRLGGRTRGRSSFSSSDDSDDPDDD